MTACGGSAEEGDHGYLPEEETTTAFTVEINTETLAPEQEEQVNALADSLNIFYDLFKLFFFSYKIINIMYRTISVIGKPCHIN